MAHTATHKELRTHEIHMIELEPSSRWPQEFNSPANHANLTQSHLLFTMRLSSHILRGQNCKTVRRLHLVLDDMASNGNAGLANI